VYAVVVVHPNGSFSIGPYWLDHIVCVLAAIVPSAPSTWIVTSFDIIATVLSP
jgi:hypothetical protein